MRAFFKTLFGDAANLAVVAIIMVVEIALVFGGHVGSAAYAVPPVTLIGVAWLARS